MDPEIEIDLPEADIDPLIQEDLQDFSDLLEVDAAQEATQVVQAAAHQIVEGVRAEKNVVQLIQYSDGSVHVLVGKTGVNLSAGQTVVYSGLTDAAANSAWGCSASNSGHGQAAGACAEHKKAIAEAEAASGIKVTGNQDGY